jgi:PST family polysaccharide transporter
VSDVGRAELDRTLLSGLAWTGVLRWVSQLISWAGTAYAARILTPGDYGIIAMAMTAIGLVRMVENFGLDAVFVQDASLTGQRQAALAGLILGLGGLLSLAFLGMAGPIAGFFNEAQVATAVSLLGLLCIGDAEQVVPRALLQRELKFKHLAGVQLLQTIVTQLILVYGARQGWGFKALILNVLGGTLVATVALVALSPFQIRWPTDLGAVARPLLQGWRVLGSRVAWYAYTTSDQTIIGKFLGKDSLGVYSFAQTFSTTVSEEVTSVVSRVVPGVFSTVQHERPELRRYFSLLTELMAYLTFPILIGTALIADLVVRIALGPQWDAVVVPLRILCVYAAFFSAKVLVAHVLMWTGQFRATMWLSVLLAIVMSGSFLLTVRWGVEGVAWTWVVVYPLANGPAMWLAFRTLDRGFSVWFHPLIPASVACLVMSAVVLGVRALLPASAHVAASASIVVAVAAATYAAVLWWFFRARVLTILEFVRGIRDE